MDKAKIGSLRKIVNKSPKPAYSRSGPASFSPIDLGALLFCNPRDVRPRRNKVKNSRRSVCRVDGTVVRRVDGTIVRSFLAFVANRSGGKSGKRVMVETSWQSLPRDAQARFRR